MKAWGQGGLNLPSAREIRTAGTEALVELAEMALDDSDRHAPRDTGEMVRSRTVTVDSSGKVGAGYTAEHAPFQHEVRGLNHDPGRGPKFLENALNGIRRKAPAVIAAKVRRALD